MIDRNLARGVFLSAIALAFGSSALKFDLGSASRAGPGLFPLVVSGLLLLIGVLTILRTKFVQPERLELKPRNISLLLLSLVAFAVVSKFLNMTLGILALAFISAQAVRPFSLSRTLMTAAGLTAIAFMFKLLLGLNLPLL